MIYFCKKDKIYNVSNIYQYVIVKRGILQRIIAKLLGEPINPNLPYPLSLEEFLQICDS